MYFQLPTPTPYPTPDALPVDMPDISLWDYTDQSIQTWNTLGEIVIIFQAVVLLMIIMFIGWAIYKYSARLSTKDHS